MTFSLLALLILFLCLPCRSFSKDYFVTYLKEQYKEKRAEGGERQELYHTWFVRTEFGDKLLVLTGQDPTYREWLREFSKNYELFLVKMPDSESAAFEQDRVVRTQVQNLHPVDKELLQKTKGKKRQKRN